MISLVIGAQGSGKTIFLVKEARTGYLQGKNVFSNVNLNFPFKKLRFQDMVDTKLENAIVIIDEGALFGFDARSSLSKENKRVTSQFLAQVRKKNLSVFISAQIVRLLDARVRENASYFIFCEKWVKKDGFWQEAVEGCDYGNVPTCIRQEVVNMGSEKVRKLYFMANPYFSMYDTSEIITQQHMELEDDD